MSFGAHWGAVARNAALAMFDGQADEDAGVMLLTDIRGIFDALHIDRIASAELVESLVNLDDAYWGESPRSLTVGRMATLLKPFRIKSRTIWPSGHHDGKSKKGYLRSQFESAWGRYCSQEVTPSPGSNIKRLREV